MEAKILNKNAFEQDAYHPLQWSSREGTGVSACGWCVCRGGVYLKRERCRTPTPHPPPDPEAGTLLWTEFLTHACEKITFPPLLLRTVTKTIEQREHNIKFKEIKLKVLKFSALVEMEMYKTLYVRKSKSEIHFVFHLILNGIK